MAKSTAVANPAPVVVPPEQQEVEVVVVRRKGNELFDVLRGYAKVDLSTLKVVEKDCSMGVALGTRIRELAKLNIYTRIHPFGKGAK